MGTSGRQLLLKFLWWTGIEVWFIFTQTTFTFGLEAQLLNQVYKLSPVKSLGVRLRRVKLKWPQPRRGSIMVWAVLGIEQDVTAVQAPVTGALFSILYCPWHYFKLETCDISFWQAQGQQSRLPYKDINEAVLNVSESPGRGHWIFCWFYWSTICHRCRTWC